MKTSVKWLRNYVDIPWDVRGLTQALTLGGLHLAVAVAVHSVIVLGAASAGGLVLKRMQGPTARALMAGGIAVVALWMAWETRG